MCDASDPSSMEDLQNLLPKSKTDVQAVDRITQVGYPVVAPILPQLLEWLQDGNWPIAKRLSPWLASLGLTLVPTLDKALAMDDPAWTYWLIEMVISRDEALYDHYREWLMRCASSPTLKEKQYEVDEVAYKALCLHGDGIDR